MYFLCWRHLSGSLTSGAKMSGNLTSGAMMSRLYVGDRQKLHFLDVRWRYSTVAQRYTKILRFTFWVPSGPTRVCINLIKSRNWYFIHTFSPIWGFYDLHYVNVRRQPKSYESDISMCVTPSKYRVRLVALGTLYVTGGTTFLPKQPRRSCSHRFRRCGLKVL